MSWLTSLFKAPKVVDTGLDLAKRGADAIDAIWFTEEEKAQAKQDWWTKVMIPLEKALAPQGSIRSVTRRIIANDFCKVYLFLILASFVVYPIDPNWSAYALRLVKILTYPVSAIVVFFFGTYGVGTYLVGKRKGGE